ncbi:unnamed protein product, partial [Didymodactylos carnosus]
IPSLNESHDRSLPNGCLVRYRCMIQDMGEDEIYCNDYTVRSNDGVDQIEKLGKYRDILVCPPGYQFVDVEPNREKFASRQLYYCTSIPNETEWVKYAYNNQSKNENDRQKRPSDDPLLQEKRVKNDCGESRSSMTIQNGTENAKQNDSYVVKVYDTSDDLLLNTIIEFIGVYYDCSDQETEMNEEVNMDDDQQKYPQIHCIQFKKLQHNNPLIDQQYGLISSSPSFVETRSYLLSLFSQLFFNDTLLCEYLLLHIISHVYVREGLCSYGKLSLNISNITHEQQCLITEFLKQILPLCTSFQLTCETLNTTQMMPNKNLTTNRLQSTKFQLPKYTQLILDETLMECGQLTPLGCTNIQLLSNILKQQKLKYEFHIYQLEYECDVKTLILSQTKSILPSIDVHIKQEKHSQQTPVLQSIPEEKLNEIRLYLTYTSHLIQFEQRDDTSTNIQNDFVNMRKQKLLTNLDDFHLLLVIA